MFKKLFILFTTILISLLSVPITQAASSSLDQYYAPGTFIHKEPIVQANEKIGQTFKPSVDRITRIDVKLDGVGQVRLSLTNNNNVQLTEKSAQADKDWLTFNLSPAIKVTPNQTYKIFLNHVSGGGESWYAGQNPVDNGNTYNRGHAIMNGFPEYDIDFHFKTFGYDQASDNPDDNEDEDQTVIPGTITTQDQDDADKEKAKKDKDDKDNIFQSMFSSDSANSLTAPIAWLINSYWWVWLIFLLAIIFLIIFYYIRNRKKKVDKEQIR